MADESDIALGVMRIAEAHGALCTFKRAYREIPDYVQLSPDNLAESVTRRGEVMWQQLVRNIKSHDKSEGNFIAQGFLEHVPRVGYRITNEGKRYLARG